MNIVEMYVVMACGEPIAAFLSCEDAENMVMCGEGMEIKCVPFFKA